MTDRWKGVVVTFDKDFRSDDAEAIVNAIRMVKHVADVSPLVRNADDFVTEHRETMRCIEAIQETLNKLLERK